MRRMLALAAASTIFLLVANGSSESSADVFRPFSDTSPWNVPAAQKGYVQADNPYAAQFGHYGSRLSIVGIPPDTAYAKPVFFAEAGDPTTTNVTLTTSWSPDGALRWDGGPIQIPAGVAPASGTDGQLSIVSADRRTAWEFWRCTSIGPDGITAAVVAQWDLTGTGYSADIHENAARASGTPIVSTVIRADEALDGIHHALGLSVPHASTDYLYPVASHSDGLLGQSAIQYGMLFVLRADYPVPADAPTAERNLLDALKTYGAYVVDQGADFELDADSTHPELWQQTGLAGASLDVGPTDFRLVRTPPSALLFEGESMTPSTSTDAIRRIADPAASEGEALSFRQSPTFATQQYTSLHEADAITLRMRSDVCQGPPEATVTIDGLPSLPIEVDSPGYADFTVPLSEATGGAPGSHTLSVGYLNNFKTETCDRNLYLDKVTITQLPETPDTTPPPAPAGLTGAIADGQVSLRWDANGEADFDHYDVLRSVGAGGPYLPVNPLPLRESQYTDDSLLNGTTYYYVVRAVDAWGNISSDSAELAAAPESPASGYVRPKGATPLRVPLVPAFQQCSAPNSDHGAPLAFSSCNPPQQASPQLTVGTPDANGQAANSIGSERLDVITGDPTTPANEADVRFLVSTSDVRQRSDLSPYPGTLQAVNTLRITDHDPTDGVAATTQDIPFSVIVRCILPPMTTFAGSTCSLGTTANAVVPGAVQEGKRTIWALDRVEVYDGGADGDASTIADNTLFETQGVFVP